MIFNVLRKFINNYYLVVTYARVYIPFYLPIVMEFKSLNIIKPILQALEKEKYVEPTPIQEKAIPLLLKNEDMIGIAQTGTGKTAAFVVPILQKLHEKNGNNKSKSPKALILAPTRELALQISDSFKTYGQFLSLKHTEVYGGVGMNPQIRALRNGIDILIATPGRLLDLMNQGRVNLKEVEYFVLDEADRMLDMGFFKDINKIASVLPKEKQSLFFSATMSKDITKLTNKFLNNPIRMEITPQFTPIERIKQRVFFIDQENKIELLLDLLGNEKMECSLIFVRTKHKADKIARMLNQKRIRVDTIHGNRSQNQRIQALNDFKSGKIRILVATDIAARGIDVDNISHVINYDLPNEPENYIHRIGRTARAGTNGIAYSFCSADERNYLNEIEKMIKTKTPHEDHKYHSIKAKDAVGKDARPKPRRQGFNQGKNTGYRKSINRNGRPSFGKSRSFRSKDRNQSRGRGNRSFGRSDNSNFRSRDRNDGRSRYESGNQSRSGSEGRKRDRNRSRGNSGFGSRRPSSNRARKGRTSFRR